MQCNTDFKLLFPLRLKQLMEENNETIYTVSSVVNLSPSTISRYINGLMVPKLPTVHVLAQYFNVNPSWLMGACEERNILPSYDVDENIDKMIFSISISLPTSAKKKLLSFAEYLLDINK